MAYWRGAKKEILNFFGYDGCVGGNYFAAIDHLGNVKSFSFWGEPAGKAEKIRFFWENSSQFNFFREWIKNPPSPCKECPFLLNCRGGCHAVAKEIMGNAFFPDPEFSFVVEYNKNKCSLFSEKF